MAETAVFLKALTPEAKASLGGSMLRIARFPFRVGRECRNTERAGQARDSRRQPDSTPNNDLYLVETGNILNVSREHFQIESRGGNYVLVDRGSTCGTLLEGEPVGERKVGGWRSLQNNDVIIAGSSESRFVFKFLLIETP